MGPSHPAMNSFALQCAERVRDCGSFPVVAFLFSFESSLLCMTGHLVQGSLGLLDTDTPGLDS